MKIVVLDGYTLNPGDLSWDALRQLGEVQVYDRTLPHEVLGRCQGAEIVLTNKVVLDASTLEALSPTLRYVGVLATGYNVVDLSEAKKRGIAVSNIPAYSTDSVVQMVFAHLLNITNQVAHYARQIREEQKWTKCLDFSYSDTPLLELHGLTMGIVGMGRIGSAVACVANAFGMKIISFTSKSEGELPPYVHKVSLDDLFRESDVLSLHCPLCENTFHLVSESSLKLMKPTTILINTGRGPLIDEVAVANALQENRLGAFAADVLSQEPPSADNPLLSAPRVWLTPHNAWATLQARKRLMEICIGNIQSFLAGNPTNIVNP